MTSLPPALRRWGPELEGVVPDLALALGAMLVRLDRLLGPMQRIRPDPTGDPDGWDDLDRRGPYDRLLMSEWGVLDADPDEFVRRAFDGEHRFHRLFRVAPIHRRRAIAVFDAGPATLGGPRVVQLAAAVVLARRARVAGLTLHVARVGGEGPALPWAGIDTLGWLARGPMGVHGDLAKRLAEVGPLGPDDDAWVVAGPGTTASVSVLTLDDVDEPDVAAVRATSRPRRGAGAALVLDRPDAALEVRLLRDPGAAWGPKPASPRPRAPRGLPHGALLGFTPDGMRLLVRDKDAVYAVPIPSAPGDPPGHAAMTRIGDAAALIWRKKQLLPVRLAHDRLACTDTKLTVDVPLSPAQLAALHARLGDPLIGIVLDLHGQQAVAFAPPSGSGPVFLVNSLQQAVVDWTPRASLAAIWRHRRSGAGALWVDGDVTRWVSGGRSHFRKMTPPPLDAGWADDAARAKGAVALVATLQGRWALTPTPDQGIPRPCPFDPAHARLLGAPPGTVHRMGRVLTLGATPLVQADAPIAAVHTTPALPCAAWQDDAGAYGVVTAEGAELLRVPAP